MFMVEEILQLTKTLKNLTARKENTQRIRKEILDLPGRKAGLRLTNFALSPFLIQKS